MKFQTKIKIDFLEFIKNGKFDYIKLGQTKEWILNNFPDPDCFSNEFLKPKCNIWTYGNIEFHFNKANELFLIFSDFIYELDGGENLDLDKWIFEDYSKLNLAYILTQLNIQEVDYCKSGDRFGIRLITKSGVELGFAKETDEVIFDSNKLHLTSFSLMDKNNSM